MAGTAWRAASVMSCTRRLMKRLSGWTTSASARLCTRLAKAVSISVPVLAVKNSICGPMAVAAASTSFFSDSVVGFCGLTSTPRCVDVGNSSCKSPSRLATQLVAHGVDTGDVAARSAEALDKAKLNRVQAEAEDDRNRRGCGFGRERRGRAARCGDDSHPAADEIGHQFRNSGKVVLCPAVFNCHVLTLDVSGFAQSFAERCQQTRRRLRRIRMHISDDRNARRLRARRARPKQRRCGHRAAESQDELAALHSITSSALNRTEVGSSRPSDLAVLRLRISSTFVGCWIGKSAGLAPLRIWPV